METGPSSERPTPRRTRRATCAVLAVAWAGAVWWLSSRSNPKSDFGIEFEFADWVAHGMEYAAGGFLTFGALFDGRTLRAALVAVLLCASWGAIDEVHQSYVPGRESSVRDVVADTVGAGLGTLLAAAWAVHGPGRGGRGTERRAADRPPRST